MSWPQNFVQSYVTHKTGENRVLVTRLSVVVWFAHVLTTCVCVCVSSEAGGEATAPEEKQRAEERVFSSGGARQAAQQDAQSKHTHTHTHTHTQEP